ncbi:cytochrome P450 [Diaporthe helianthi]|uniref:Cytochrome P450 n=1 Tax=Diaporthe helianthi TaxID=158607 RepID=A0A2P5IB16_DIAHE|nr:cytochrome P450 [Diaporthe helianthi]
MSNTSSGTLGRYFKMESSVDFISSSTPVVVRSQHLSYYVAIGAILLVAWLFQSSKTSDTKRVKAPFYKASILKWYFDAETLVRDSYIKVYQIKATEGVQVLVPARLLGELKGLPEDVLSATEAVSEAMMSRYTKFSPERHLDLLTAVVRRRLTQNLARLTPKLKEEVKYITATEFPECKEWTPVKFQPFALRCVARTSSRAFVGPSICRQEQWMGITINYAVHIFLSLVKLQFFPAWLRPIGQYLVSDLRKLRKDEAVAKEILIPIIEERLRDMDCPGYEKEDDLVQWLLDALPDCEKRDYQAQAELQLILSAASIHTTTNLLVDCVYDLAANPQFAEELRQEATAVLEGEDNGWARKESMSKLKKLDSFMKEVQRLSGNVTSFIRKAIQPIDLSDGTHLPAGTKVLAPQCGISHDERYFPEPDLFDALRFYKMRHRSDDDMNRHQFTSISDINMNFGAGKHACPGRFFAGNEIKMILAYFLINFDIKLKDGESRPKSMMLMMSKTPNPNAEIMFRRRAVDA